MRVHTPDLDLAYEVSGRGRQCVVFLPALGTTSEMWRPQLDAFAHDYLLICCETGGHDALVHGRLPVSLPGYARGVLAVLNAVGAPAAHVVGLSMGGMIAQELALAQPERVRSLVLASTTSEYPHEARAQLQRRANEAEARGMAALVEPTMERWFSARFKQESSDRVAWIAAMFESADPVVYAAAARTVAEVNTTDRLPAITAPALVIRGSGDPSISPEAAERIARQLPVATLATFEAAHMCNIECADQFNELVRPFLVDTVAESTADEDLVPMSPW